MRKKKFLRIGHRLIISAASVILVLAMNLTTVFAASANIIFDKSPYSATYKNPDNENTNKLSFDLSINCDEKPATYYVELVYDTARLQYTGGADKEDQDILILEGTATAKSIVYTLNFDVKSGGNAGIYVSYAEIVSADGKTRLDISTRDFGTITIQGEDISGAEDFGHNVKDINSKIPFLGNVYINNEEFYIPDQSQYIPDTADWAYSQTEGTLALSDGTVKNLTYLTGTDSQMRYLYLMDGQGNFQLFAIGADGTFYPCVESDQYFYVSALAGNALPDSMTVDDIVTNNIVYLQYKDGTGKFAFKNADGQFEVWSTESKYAADQNKIMDSSASTSENGDANDDSSADSTTLDAKANSGIMNFQERMPQIIVKLILVLIAFTLIILLVVVLKSNHSRKKEKKNRDNDKQGKEIMNKVPDDSHIIREEKTNGDGGLIFENRQKQPSDFRNSEEDDFWEKLRDISDETEAVSEDKLSFTANLKMNLTQLENPGMLSEESDVSPIIDNDHIEVKEDEISEKKQNRKDTINYEEALKNELKSLGFVYENDK